MEFTAMDILKLLPHRSPFLLIDKVLECVPGKSAIGIKNVTIDEPFFNGHFPVEPIFPGVLTIETIAQTTAVMYGSKYLSIANGEELAEVDSKTVAQHIGYLVSANVKFLQPIRPGDTMKVKVQHKQTMGILMKIEAEVYVDAVCVAKGTISVSEKP